MQAELKLRAHAPFDVGFNGELKTTGDSRMFDAAGAYALLELHRKFFEEWYAGEIPCTAIGGRAGGISSANPTTRLVRPWRVFFDPPVAYSVTGTAPVAWLTLAEWTGRLFLTPASQPFFIGSPEHAAAVERIDASTRSGGGGGGGSGGGGSSSIRAGKPFVDLDAVANGTHWVTKPSSKCVWTTQHSISVPGLGAGGVLDEDAIAPLAAPRSSR